LKNAEQGRSMDEEEKERDGSEAAGPAPELIRPPARQGESVKAQLRNQQSLIEARAAGEANAGNGHKDDGDERKPSQQFAGNELPSAHSAQNASEPPSAQESLRTDATAAAEFFPCGSSCALNRTGGRLIKSRVSQGSNANRKFEIVGQVRIERREKIAADTENRSITREHRTDAVFQGIEPGLISLVEAASMRHAAVACGALGTLATGNASDSAIRKIASDRMQGIPGDVRIRVGEKEQLS